MDVCVEALSSIFTFVTAIAALWAAYETRKTAKKTQETVEGQMLNGFLKDYSSEKMLICVDKV